MIKKVLLLPIKLIFRIIVSPFILFIVGYLYYGNVKDAYYLALLGYTALVILLLIYTGMTIIPAMAKFKILKFMHKSYKVITMLFALGVYWLIYLLFWT